jgi:site-specific recombinase XerD
MEKEKNWSVGSLSEAFETHLRVVHGASPKTCDLYKQGVIDFLKAKYGKKSIDLSTLHPLDLISFVTEYSSRYKPKTTQLLASSLRRFLLFLQLNGLCDARLVEAVPTVANHKLAVLPATLSAEQVTRLLSSFDQSSASGLRGYAVACCLTYLGLRADEVAHLSLEDIDWRAATLRIPKTKPRRPGLLPLPNQVGQAIADYLQRGRPATPERRIFVRHRRPVGEPLTSFAVQSTIRRAFLRANLDTASKGTHILRHTLATQMIRKGASLKEIADVLRHRHLDTTFIYTKVDLPMLAEVAMPWPEVKK